jgi:hypothetical protein
VTNHIDVSAVLRHTVSDHFSDLVTRPTGAAVRTQIERQVSLLGAPVTVIDFSHVRMLDFSCADEVVAKLLLRYADDATPLPGRAADAPPLGPDTYLVFRGVSDAHLDAIEAVLERHGLALVIEPADGPPLILGTLGDLERIAWDTITRLGGAAAADVALAAGCGVTDAESVLEQLRRRRLVRRRGAHYVAVWEGEEA